MISGPFPHNWGIQITLSNQLLTIDKVTILIIQWYHVIVIAKVR